MFITKRRGQEIEVGVDFFSIKRGRIEFFFSNRGENFPTPLPVINDRSLCFSSPPPELIILGENLSSLDTPIYIVRKKDNV